LWLVATMTLVSMWIVRAQQPAAPRAGAAAPDPSTQLQVNRVTRKAGERSRWHSHPKGQVFWVDEGRGRLQERGGRVVELRKHDEPVYTPPDVEHWHGAAPDEGVTYIAIACCADNYVKWLEEDVSDQVYKGKFIRRQEATAADLQAKRNK
jgi:quercetin dioxygenase-like cupin family protein